LLAVPIAVIARFLQEVLRPSNDHCHNRRDGWPQKTAVGYVNDGITLYVLCGEQSQKAKNLAADNRVSLTIDHEHT
jgi:hypothetical protein